MNNVKPLADWEREKNCLFTKATPLELSSGLSEEEFVRKQAEDAISVIGVMWDDRIKFLKANSYELTRENMVANLSNRITPEPVVETAELEEILTSILIPESPMVVEGTADEDDTLTVSPEPAE